jgi:hypothetical protein
MKLAVRGDYIAKGQAALTSLSTEFRTNKGTKIKTTGYFVSWQVNLVIYC